MIPPCDPRRDGLAVAGARAWRRRFAAVLFHGFQGLTLHGFNFNETEAESSSHWMDDRENYIKRDVVKNCFDEILSPDDNRMDPQLMADAMVSIIPEDTGLFRNVVPKATEELARKIQSELWDARIDLPSSR